MKNMRFRSKVLVVAILTFTLGSIANATVMPSRIWVASNGFDSPGNPCARNTPCLTFAGALLKVAPGGEINCVDAADYGVVTISQAVTIDCLGVQGSILVPSGQTGITITAGASDVVTIRSVSVNGTGVGSQGINGQTAKAIHLENVNVSGVTGACVRVGVSASSLVSIDNATLSDCQSGVLLVATGTTVIANISNARISNTQFGLNADNGSRVTLRDSIVSSNTNGITQPAAGGSANGSVVTVINTTFAYSSVAALQSHSGEFILAFGNSFINNVVVFNPNGGQIYTGADNNNSGSGTVGTTAGTVPKI